jgi:hypothetical protein
MTTAGASRLVTLVFALVSCGDAETAGYASVEPEATPYEARPTLDGTWAMYTADTDHLVVVVDDEGGLLTGFGCFAGLPLDGAWEDTCGDLVDGRIDGERAQFGFVVPFSGSISYWNEVFVASDSPRLGGSASYEHMGYAAEPSKAVWLPLEPGSSWLSSDLQWPEAIAWEDDGAGYDLTLEGAARGSEFELGQTYFINRYRNGLVGDLGAFWASELHFEGELGDEPVLVAGPVAETVPEQPVHLVLGFEERALVRVEARTSAGVSYTFAATPRSGG